MEVTRDSPRDKGGDSGPENDAADAMRCSSRGRQNQHAWTRKVYRVWPQNSPQEIGNRLYRPVRPIQPIVLFPVGILRPHLINIFLTYSIHRLN